MVRKDEHSIGDLEHHKKRIRNVRNALLWVFAASFVVFLVIAALAILNEGVDRFVASLLSINPFYFGLSFIVIFISYLMRYPKWDLYMKKLGVKISMGKNMAIYLSMYSMEITPGRWGRGVVSYTLNKLTGIRFGRTFPAIVVDILTDFIGFIIVCLGAALFLNQYVALTIFITIILTIPFIFLYVRGPFNFISKRFGGIKRLRPFFDNARLYFRNKGRLDIWTYTYSVIITVPAILLNGIALYLVILAFGVNLPLSAMPLVIFVFSSSLMLGWVSGIPATIGVTDAAMISYLTLFFGGVGIDFGLASIITIFFRIVNIWFVEAFGFAALTYTFKYWELPVVPRLVKRSKLGQAF